MTTVRVEPSGVEIEVSDGESVAEAAWRLGATWPTKCWGQAECSICFVKVLEGELQTVPPGDEELDAMRALMPRRLRGPLTRLGCRLKVQGPGVVVEKKGVRAAPASDPSPSAESTVQAPVEEKARP
jgi:2Fe-2S ferredoxin